MENKLHMDLFRDVCLVPALTGHYKIDVKKKEVHKHDTKPHVTTNREARRNDMIKPNKVKRKQPHDQDVKPNH